MSAPFYAVYIKDTSIVQQKQNRSDIKSIICPNRYKKSTRFVKWFSKHIFIRCYKRNLYISKFFTITMPSLTITKHYNMSNESDSMDDFDILLRYFRAQDDPPSRFLKEHIWILYWYFGICVHGFIMHLFLVKLKSL